ncbi:restriction endonuclease [Auraticoccus sp. F435]|uniref:Restriction endonuclease n=1 Tax=Auraticoccus cholistanensis TaxID=2656650 RepID=A0A6A9V1I2_9ACTN|nr:restriction endonuclease [Auraticoccus cholistanensis]MVA77459.1 restriction endonuclease [Auraticoccus cholistanensis]
MAMPKWHEFMAPILKVMSDGQVRDRSQITELAADLAGVTPEERRVTLTTGQPMHANRVGWAISHLTKAGALARPERGTYVISDVGRQLLATHPGVSRADVAMVTGYRRVRTLTTGTDSDVGETVVEALDPRELIDQGIKQINAEVASELLARLHAKSPAFFEDAVVRLLVAMGYGGADGQATVTQQSNDGGIDGIIDQDTLGLNRVYVQAKRYAVDSSVGRPELQAFVGALSGKADGGVFITTGRFSAGAREYASSVPTRIVLIDGQRLAALMIRYAVGVQAKQTVHIVEIDEDFFE